MLYSFKLVCKGESLVSIWCCFVYILFGLYVCVFCQMMVPARESVLLSNWLVGRLNVWYAATESGNMILFGVVLTATMCCTWNVLRSGPSLQSQVGILYLKKTVFLWSLCVWYSQKLRMQYSQSLTDASDVVEFCSIMAYFNYKKKIYI
jgi:hypothetical protein